MLLISSNIQDLQQGVFFRSPPPFLRVTLGIVPIPPGPSQCLYTKTLFQNNSYESVYGLAWLRTNLNTITEQLQSVVEWARERGDNKNTMQARRIRTNRDDNVSRYNNFQ